MASRRPSRKGVFRPRRGPAAQIVPQVAAELGAAAVHTLTHYEPWAKAQDAAVAKVVDLKRYHDGVLAFGAPPVRFARALYLNEAIR